MYNPKCVRLLLPIGWLVITFYYIVYSIISIDAEKSVLKNSFQETSSEYYATEKSSEEEESNKDYLINTPGCSIPNYMNTMRIKEAAFVKESTCGTRVVFIKRISADEIAFTIDEAKMKHYTNGKKYSCCYQFGFPAITAGKEDYTELRYSNCKDFKNNSTGALETEIITVTCSLHLSKRGIYDDSYVILIKKHVRSSEDNVQKNKNPFNVLILGMDTMSRARAYSSLPKTVKFMLQNNWLDYKGYQKVGYNTYPNVMALLTGQKISTIYKACSSGMDHCNHLIIWSKFKNAGYITASGEEYLRLPDTFSKLGYKSPPTDHYLRPFFLTGENTHGNIVCAKKTPSAKHLLDYASSFAETYKEENFFGMFWFNSYSHNLNNIPNLIDDDIMGFFSQLKENGVLDNTFVYFLSDHGIRNGKMRELYESYYEERLPMFFLWVPTEFRSIREQEYNNLKLNRNRLITPYDLYLTIYDTMTKSQDSEELRSDACPHCMSIFKEVNIHRTCDEASVDEKWCTCHDMADISHNNNDVITATKLAVIHLQEQIRKIKATQCMTCEVLQLKSVMRTHTYRDDSRNSTYFVIAIVMSPGDVAYEATVVKYNETFNLILPTYTISVYNTRGNCVAEPNDRAYCVCKKIPKCTRHH